MRIHYLQHVPFEGPGMISLWARESNNTLSSTLLYRGDTFPAQDTFDWLIVMGGPMGVYDEDRYGWLAQEKAFIKQAIDSNKLVLGICLGAQLIAAVLGAEVKRNTCKEIGWFQVNLTAQGRQSPMFSSFPDTFMAFHWHGDTFEIPVGAHRLAQSEACVNQAFIYQNRVLGLQFHLEASSQSLHNLIENCREELVTSSYIQPEASIVSEENKDNLISANQQMVRLLTNLEILNS
ncbi:MAG TPA: amidotransferase [Candidatus Margulisbacteria bacterium]|nr:MAG: amidotransferase [Candidatus Margulisbacteria bacterium GWD2_39_127]OGI03846.1 MAG: amidotransferase [Candidatus Margulisbacteria bacterium GWF2_38_17]HAR63536.1 amidotransferase [Candidatus Margulisiibacteriota bacterium]